MFSTTPLPLGDLLGAFCIALVAAMTLRFYLRIVDEKATSLDFFLFGFMAFHILDIAKYQFYEHGDRYLGTPTQVMVVVAVFTSLLLVLAGYRFAPFLPHKRRLPIPFEPPHIPFVMSVVLPLCVLVLPLHLVTYEAQEKSGYLSLIGHGLKAVVIFLFSLYLLTGKRALLITAVAGLAVSLTDTSRRAMIVVFFPLLMLYLDSRSDARRRSDTPRLALIALLFLGLFVFLNFMRADHDFGYGYVEGARVQNTVNYILTLRSIDTFFNTGFIFENIPDNFSYFWGSTYAALPLSPLPRDFWPDKPYGLGAQLGYMQMFFSDDFDLERWMNSGLFSLSPGFVGEAYANFGIPGIVLVSLGTGVGLRHFDVRFTSSIQGDRRFLWRNRMPYVVFLPGFLLMGRGDFYSAAIYPTYLFFSLIGLVWFLHVFRRAPNARTGVHNSSRSGT